MTCFLLYTRLARPVLFEPAYLVFPCTPFPFNDENFGATVRKAPGKRRLPGIYIIFFFFLLFCKGYVLKVKNNCATVRNKMQNRVNHYFSEKYALSGSALFAHFFRTVRTTCHFPGNSAKKCGVVHYLVRCYLADNKRKTKFPYCCTPETPLFFKGVYDLCLQIILFIAFLVYLLHIIGIVCIFAE